MKKKNILIIEPDQQLQEILEISFANPKRVLHVASDVRAAQTLLAQESLIELDCVIYNFGPSVKTSERDIKNFEEFCKERFAAHPRFLSATSPVNVLLDLKALKNLSSSI